MDDSFGRLEYLRNWDSGTGIWIEALFTAFMYIVYHYLIFRTTLHRLLGRIKGISQPGCMIPMDNLSIALLPVADALCLSGSIAGL